MTEWHSEYQPQSYADLEPGLRAALDLLDQEIRVERDAGDRADAREDKGSAFEHARNVKALAMAREIIREQRDRLRPPDSAGSPEASDFGGAT